MLPPSVNTVTIHRPIKPESFHLVLHLKMVLKMSEKMCKLPHTHILDLDKNRVMYRTLNPRVRSLHEAKIQIK